MSLLPRARTCARGLVAALAMAIGPALPSCAPLGPYRGPRPVPDAPPSGGTQSVASQDSTVVIIYGDNRPGHMTLSAPIGAPIVLRSLRLRSPVEWMKGLINLPVAIAQAALPTLDGVRDTWSQFGSHRFAGGNERGVLSAVEREPHVDLVINTGDLVQDGRRGGQWMDFAKRHASLRRHVPFVAAAGNHERTDLPVARANWDAVMGPGDLPLQYARSVEVGNGLARFVILDSNVLADPKDLWPAPRERALADAQLAWADSVLARPALYKFVVLHHPLVSAGHHLEDWTHAGRKPGVDRRGRLLEIARAHDVVAIFAGHEHLFQRSRLHRGADGLWHVTTGGGGSPLYRLSGEERRRAARVPLPEGWALAYRGHEHSVYNFCRLVLRGGPGERAADMRVYRVRRNHAAELIDRCDLSRPQPQ